MCVYVCRSMCVCMFVCMYIVCVRVYVYVVCICVYVCMCVCMCVCVRVHVCASCVEKCTAIEHLPMLSGALDTCMWPVFHLGCITTYSNFGSLAYGGSEYHC